MEAAVELGLNWAALVVVKELSEPPVVSRHRSYGVSRFFSFGVGWGWVISGVLRAL